MVTHSEIYPVIRGVWNLSSLHIQAALATHPISNVEVKGKNGIISAISLQQEFTKKTGVSTELPEAVKNVIVDTGKQITKARSVQNHSTNNHQFCLKTSRY